jgi:hypothetical protein
MTKVAILFVFATFFSKKIIAAAELRRQAMHPGVDW